MRQGEDKSTRVVVINEKGEGELPARHDGEAGPVRLVQPLALADGEPRLPAPSYSEEVQRVVVADEDRQAFRVGVNILVLLLLALAGYLIWRNFFQ